MTRYYFDLVENGWTSIDEEGLELPNVQKVIQEAARSLCDAAKDTALTKEGEPAGRLAIQVRDKNGPVLQARLTFEFDHSRKQ